MSYEREAWEAHYKRLKWRQGEHLLIAAPTGSGKSTFASRVLDKRKHVVMFVSKLHDDVFRREFRHYRRITQWPPPRFEDKVLLWPKPAKTARDTVRMQREVFGEALDALINSQGYCVVIDELHWTTDPRFLNLGPEVAILHHQGRSSGTSVVNLTQRPAWIPKIIYSSVTHAYIARTRDRDDLKRLADLGGIDPKAVATAVQGMPSRFDYLYVNPQGDGLPRVVNTRS